MVMSVARPLAVIVRCSVLGSKAVRIVRVTCGFILEMARMTLKVLCLLVRVNLHRARELLCMIRSAKSLVCLLGCSVVVAVGG